MPTMLVRGIIGFALATALSPIWGDFLKLPVCIGPWFTILMLARQEAAP